MANIKDIHGNLLSLSASDILIPSLGVSLADAISQKLLPVPDNVTEQVEGLESKVAHAVGTISSVTVDVATDDTGTTHAEGAYQDGVLSIKLYNAKGEKGEPLTFDDLTDEQKAELKGEGGKSAYESAVQNGFTGTEEEWLESLKCKVANSVDKTDSVKTPSGQAVYNFVAEYVGEHNGGEISTIIDRYKGKKCSILGDSISTFGVPSSTNTQGLYTYKGNMCRYSQDGIDSIRFNVQDTWWMQVITRLGMTLGVNESWRGTSVSSVRTSVGTPFSSQTRINHLGNNGKPDLILVYGGTNDAGANVTIGTFNTENPKNYTAEQIANLPIDTFANAYRTMIIRLIKTYPNAEIVAILPNLCTDYYSIARLDLYIECIKEICDYFGVKYIDIRRAGISVYNLNSYLVDGIHPNKEGMSLIADNIYRSLIFK